jgi:ATP-dependent DNA helicase RecG
MAFRDTIRNYPKEVIRELLINAIAHKRYISSGDIFLEVYPDRIIFTNPGGLPMGISKDNILHERQRRNPHLIQTLHDLMLMESEGSDYDLIYEKLSLDAKPFPEIESSYSKMAVIVYSGIIDEEALSIIDYITKNFALTQKEAITLYLNNPDLFAQAKLNLTPSLRTIEPHMLEALIMEDLKYNGKSKMAEIQKRLKEVYPDDIQKSVYKMVEKGSLHIVGAYKNRMYEIQKKVNLK